MVDAAIAGLQSDRVCHAKAGISRSRAAKLLTQQDQTLTHETSRYSYPRMDLVVLVRPGICQVCFNNGVAVRQPPPQWTANDKANDAHRPQAYRRCGAFESRVRSSRLQPSALGIPLTSIPRVLIPQIACWPRGTPFASVRCRSDLTSKAHASAS